jgi:hypothetical protein
LDRRVKENQVKLVKMLSIAAVAAVAAMALIGTATASATTLCKANESKCATANTWPIGTKVVSTLEAGTEAKLEGIITTKCKNSEVVGETTKAGSPLIGKVTKVSFTNCTGCKTVKELHMPYEAKIAATTGGNGTLTTTTGGSGSPGSVLSECGGPGPCTAESASISLDVTGGLGGSEGADAKVVAEKEPLSLSGFLCLGSGAWSANYRITSATEPGKTAITNPPGFISATP